MGKPATDIGPGAYVGVDPPKTLHAYAPFSSTTIREQQYASFTPGPGSYSASNLLGTKPVYADPLAGERLTGPFASKNERFRGKKQELLPGPGAYDVGTTWSKARKAPPKQEWNSMNWLRLPSAPSIPAPSQAFGYDETANGELVMQKNPEKVYEGTMKDSVGPGHYNVRKADEVWKAKGTAWHKSKAQRLTSTAPTTGPKVGPGAYNEFQISLAPMYKFRPNAVFASSSKRASYVPANDPKAVKSEANSDEEDEREDAIPGPGTYLSAEHASSFNVRPVPQRLQFFGSTSSRFDRKKPLNPAVGPGTYGDLRKPVVPAQGSDGKAPFSSKDHRFHQRPNSNPGPGSYKELHFTEDSKRKVWGRQGVFGTTEKRFVAAAGGVATPGPGYYPPDADKRVGIHNTVKRKPHSVFASKSKRTLDVKQEGPAPGQYEAVSGFSPKTTVGGTGNPLLAGIGENKKREAAFNSKSQRFSGNSQEAPLGPGTYDPKLPGHKPAFIPKASRFQDKARGSNPGPGSYYDEQLGTWNKRSYNILFTEYV